MARRLTDEDISRTAVPARLSHRGRVADGLGRGRGRVGSLRTGARALASDHDTTTSAATTTAAAIFGVNDDALGEARVTSLGAGGALGQLRLAGRDGARGRSRLSHMRDRLVDGRGDRLGLYCQF